VLEIQIIWGGCKKNMMFCVAWGVTTRWVDQLGIKDRKEYTRIIAYAPPSSINYAIQLSKTRAIGSTPSRPSIDATSREKGAAMEGTEEYL
jgi:hypothetical protein